jgi:hypothetical protein
MERGVEVNLYLFGLFEIREEKSIHLQRLSQYNYSGMALLKLMQKIERCE